VQKKISNIRDLKLAKSELKGRIELNEAKLQMELEQVKAHYLKLETYLPVKTPSASSSSFLSTTLKTLASNLALDKLVGSKSTLVNRFGKILVQFLLK